VSVALPGPTRLAVAVTAAVQAHPYASSGTVVPSARLDIDAAALWLRLSSLDDHALGRAVDALHEFELRILLATARSRLSVARTADVLARLLERRCPSGAAALAWDAYLLTDGREALRPLASAHVREQGQLRRSWPALLGDGGPIRAACALYRSQRDVFARWIALPAVALEPWPEFVRRVQAVLLAPGDLARLDRHEVPVVVAQWVMSALPAGDRETWYAAFLEETRSNRRPPDHAVLDAILDRFGDPASGRPFWDGLSVAARAAFTAWLMDRRLTQLLGEGDRIEFWRRFLPHIDRATPNRDRQVVLIKLGGVVAIQFVNAGTATYLFREAAVRGLARYYEVDLQREVRNNAHRSLGSYEHRGYRDTWQRQADAVVRRVLAEVAHE